ncbi:MAG: SusC/RagA family TonB-linked outer membrane protein [Chitinophagia bacterium]|nr:SusC/RagA family TonB-linked outer membrane protein [Chitinophagia bacterium]
MKTRTISRYGKWKYFCLSLTLSLFAVIAFGQVRISGKITSSGGASVESVSVTVKGTKYGTTADASGNYSFTAPLNQGNYSLIFSGIGLGEQVSSLTIGSAKTYTVDVTMSEKVSKLDEVVVTGTSAGTTRRQLGSYVATLKASDISKGAAANALQALQGKTPGAVITQNSGDPAGGLSVRLRGVSSVNSSSEPLYIVDGVIVNNSTPRVTNTQSGYDGGNFVGVVGQNRMVDINPADIERVEVLNGAAAAAIYGSRANSGVIQIFTKRGVSGAPQVSFSSNVLFSGLRKKLDVNQAPTKFGGDINAQTQDILSPNLTNTTPVTRYDYQDVIFRGAMGTDNNVSVSGGTDNTKYFFSGSYFYNQGIIRNTDFQRFSFRSNIDQKINKWISMNLGLNYVNSSANEKPDGNSFFSPMNSVTILGNFHDITSRDALGNLKAHGNLGRVNPVSVIEDFKQRNNTSRILTNFGLKLKPIKNLTIDYSMGIDNYAQSGTTFMPPFAYNVNAAFFGGGTTSSDPTLNGYASAASSNFFGINHDINATYSTSITSDISSVTQVGFSQQYERNSYVMLQGRGLAPFVETVNGASTIIPGSDSRAELSISGFFLQQNFKFKNQFFLTGAIRRDASSVFGPDKRNQVYTKANAGFILSETKFWKGLGVNKWWDLAKVRVAYGESGNLTGIGAYDRFNVYTASSFNSRTALNTSSTLANTNVGPERQKEIEFGLDLSFLDSRINLNLNIYDKRVNDMLLNRFIAPSAGFSTLLDNIGNLKNTGYEVMLSATPVKKKDFIWNITGIYNRNRNEVLNIGASLITFPTNQGAPVALIQGQPVGVFYGTFFATTAGGTFSKNSIGVPNHDGLDLSPAGIPRGAFGTQNSVLSYTQSNYNPGGPAGQGIPVGVPLRRIIGNPNPLYTATLINEFSYKKFSLRIQIDATKGNSVFNADFRTRQGVGNGKVAELEHRGLLPRGYISGYNASAAFPTGIYNIEEWRVDDGSNVRIREFALSYSIGKVGKIVKDLNVNFTGRNLVVWTKYIGYDPEVNAGGQSTILRGIDFGSVPIPRTISVGLQAKF